MKMRKVMQRIVPILIVPVMLFLVQAQAHAAVDTSGQPVLQESKKETPAPAEEESSLSKPLLIGLGAAVLVGGAVALGSSGGGGGSDNPAAPPAAPAQPTPISPDQLVSAWHAEGNQPGSGLTYSGTYQLYQGGGLGYNLYVSDGEHFVGGGGWRLNGNTLYMHTDHGGKGSIYTGNVPSGTVTAISLNSDTGWNLTLTR